MLKENMTKRIQAALDVRGEMDPSEYEKLESSMYAMRGACDGYRATYKNDFVTYDVLGVEQEFEVEIAGRLMRGKLDLCLRDKSDGSLGYMDHKFLRTISTSTYDVLPLSLQQLIYSKAFESIVGELPSWYRWNTIKKSGLRRKGLGLKKDGSRQVPERPEEYIARVMQQYVKEPEKMFHRTPPRVVEVEALGYVEEQLALIFAEHDRALEAGDIPAMRFSSCVGRYESTCLYAHACTEIMLGHKTGWNAPRCRGEYRAKDKLHSELS
jgi:hypothetical protein